MNDDKTPAGVVVPMLNPRSSPTSVDAAWLDEGARLPSVPRASLDRALRILWLWKWRLLLICVPILLAGLAYLLITPERYTAHATVMVGVRQSELSTDEQARMPLRGEPDVDGAIRLMRARMALQHVAKELNLAARPEFENAIRQRKSLISRVRGTVFSLLGRTGRIPGEGAERDPSELIAAQLEKDIRIDRVGRSALLDVAYSSSDPALAAAIVNALARFASEDEAFLSRMTLAERAGFQIVKISVMSEAVPPNEVSSPNAAVILGGTMFLALIAAFSIMLLREFQRHQTILSTEDLTRRGVRPLGLIPENRAVARGGIRLVTDDPGNAFSVSVASLHAAISTLPRIKSERCAILLLTSALPGEGKSTTAAALATSMAALGRRVLLIDANLRSPKLHRSFNLELSPGLAECVGAQTPAGEVIRHDPVTGVFLLAAGDTYDRPLHVVGSPRLRGLLDHWRTQFDVILIDAPPVLVAGDARVLAQVSDHVIVVVRWGATKWNLLNHALLMLEGSGAHIAGAVISRVNVKKLSAYSSADAQIYRSFSKDRAYARRH
jgi:capsular exopolysaccharide synthesis family protein